MASSPIPSSQTGPGSGTGLIGALAASIAKVAAGAADGSDRTIVIAGTPFELFDVFAVNRNAIGGSPSAAKAGSSNGPANSLLPLHV